MIDDTRARRLANDLKRCSYYETCATYGLNVERVFQDGEWFWFIIESQNFSGLLISSSFSDKIGYLLMFQRCIIILSCQPRVIVTSCFIYNVIRTYNQ